MRGPLLSGPLGRASSLEAVFSGLQSARNVVVIGPMWLADVLSSRVPVLLLIEPQERGRARRVVKRAGAAGRRLTVAAAEVDLPLLPGSVDALLVEGASALEPDAAARWLESLIPPLRPGGRLIAADVSGSPAVEARLAGLFLAAALTEIAQHRPREGVFLTVGAAPLPQIVAARFGVPV